MVNRKQRSFHSTAMHTTTHQWFTNRITATDSNCYLVFLQVHKQAEDDLQQLLGNLNDLLVKVDIANVVLKQTKGIVR